MLDFDKLTYDIAKEVTETYGSNAAMNFDDGPKDWDGWYDGDLGSVIDLAVKRTLEAVRDEFKNLTA